MTKRSIQGFTLIELMVTVVIIAILAAVALPSYNEYIRRSNASQAQQHIQHIATLLEQHRSRNFNYLGYVIPTDLQNLPKTGTPIKYEFTVRDGDSAVALTNAAASGQAWVLRAENKLSNNFSFVYTSTGVKCKTKTWSEITGTTATTMSCGANGEAW